MIGRVPVLRGDDEVIAPSAIRRLAIGTTASPSVTARFPPGQNPTWISMRSRHFMALSLTQA